MRTTPVVALAASTIPLFGLASGGVYLAIDVTINAVRSYRHLFTLTSFSITEIGGIFSVALSVGLRLPGVTWHLVL